MSNTEPSSPASVHSDVPTNDAGHPVHPEEGHAICGAKKSETSTPAPHGRARNDIPFCLQAAGKGTDHVGEGRCGLHGGASQGAPVGESNGNYQHGAFSRVMRETISDDEKEMVDEFITSTADPHSDEARRVVQEAAALALVKFNRSGNPKFLAEYRQLCSEFNLVDATQHVAHGDSETWYERLEAAESAVDDNGDTGGSDGEDEDDDADDYTLDRDGEDLL